MGWWIVGGVVVAFCYLLTWSMCKVAADADERSGLK